MGRYTRFIQNGGMRVVPHIKIRSKSTDKSVRWNKQLHRLDVISYTYYNDATFGWLILLANPQLPAEEFSIEDNTLIRIPYPLAASLRQYDEAITNYINRNGI